MDNLQAIFLKISVQERAKKHNRSGSFDQFFSGNAVHLITTLVNNYQDAVTAFNSARGQAALDTWSSVLAADPTGSQALDVRLR